MATTAATANLVAPLAAGATLDAADTAWMLVATALVLLMTPALAFFYGGLVRSKNALNTMFMSFAALGAVGVVWAVAGYSLAFAPGSAWLGGLDHLLAASTTCCSVAWSWKPTGRSRTCCSWPFRAPSRSSLRR
jgi:Amt family ammonium transporter